MKIIALSCSPSKGRNSDTMLDNFILGTREVKGVEIEKVYLCDINIDYYSFENSTGAGEHEKEFKELTDKLREAQGFVIATPTYNFSVPAQLKNFIDRIRFIALDLEDKTWIDQPRGKLNHLRMYFLVSGGTPTWAKNLFFYAFPPFWLRNIFLYFGARVMGAMYTGDVHSFHDDKFKNKCHKMGKHYATDLILNRHHGLLEDIFWRPPQAK